MIVIVIKRSMVLRCPAGLCVTENFIQTHVQSGFMGLRQFGQNSLGRAQSAIRLLAWHCEAIGGIWFLMPDSSHEARVWVFGKLRGLSDEYHGDLERLECIDCSTQRAF